jgi:flagellar protein FliO/FliZ
LGDAYIRASGKQRSLYGHYSLGFRHMMSWLGWLSFLIFLAAAAGAAAWGYRAYMTGDTSINFSFGNWFGQRAEPRLGVVEQATVDSRRKLVLIRRDDVEHLIMTGGPVDVLIETGIQAPLMEEAVSEHTTAAEPPPAPPVFTRKPRSFGQAVNE